MANSFSKFQFKEEDDLNANTNDTQKFLMNSPAFMKESGKLTAIFFSLSKDVDTTSHFVKKYTVIIYDLVEEFRNSNIPLTQVRFEEIISECNAKWFLEKCKNSKVKK